MCWSQALSLIVEFSCCCFRRIFADKFIYLPFIYSRGLRVSVQLTSWSHHCGNRRKDSHITDIRKTPFCEITKSCSSHKNCDFLYNAVLGLNWQGNWSDCVWVGSVGSQEGTAWVTVATWCEGALWMIMGSVLCSLQAWTTPHIDIKWKKLFTEWDGHSRWLGFHSKIAILPCKHTAVTLTPTEALLLWSSVSLLHWLEEAGH